MKKGISFLILILAGMLISQCINYAVNYSVETIQYDIPYFWKAKNNESDYMITKYKNMGNGIVIRVDITYEKAWDEKGNKNSYHIISVEAVQFRHNILGSNFVRVTSYGNNKYDKLDGTGKIIGIDYTISYDRVDGGYLFDTPWGIDHMESLDDSVLFTDFTN